MTILSALLSLTLWQDIGYAEAKERALAFREVAARAFTDGYVGYVPSSTIYDSFLEEDRIPRAYRIRFPDGVVRVSAALGRVVESSINERPYPMSWDPTRSISRSQAVTKVLRYYEAAGYDGELNVLRIEEPYLLGTFPYIQIGATPTANGVPYHAEHMTMFFIRYDTGMLEWFSVGSCPKPPLDLTAECGAQEATQKMLDCLRGKVTYLPVKELSEVQLGIWRPHDAAGNLVPMDERYIRMGQNDDGLLVWWGVFVDEKYPRGAFRSAFNACVDAKTGELIFAEVPRVFGGTRNGRPNSMLRWDLGSGPITMYVPGKKPITIRQADVTAVPTPKGQSSAGRRLELQRGRLFIQARYNRQTGLLRMEGSGAYGRPNSTLKPALDKLCRTN